LYSPEGVESSKHYIVGDSRYTSWCQLKKGTIYFTETHAQDSHMLKLKSRLDREDEV